MNLAAVSSLRGWRFVVYILLGVEGLKRTMLSTIREFGRKRIKETKERILVYGELELIMM